MSPIKALWLGIALPASLALAQSSGTGTLLGSVTGTNGAPLAGAEVRYMSAVPPEAVGAGAIPAPGTALVSGTVLTDAHGNFEVDNLPAGLYGICADVPASRYLDNCVWGVGLQVTVPAGATATSNVVLEEGVYLSVRINDPMLLLPQAVDGLWTRRKLVVGVLYGSGAYQGAQNTAVDPQGRNYQLALPAGKPFTLWLYSTDIALADANSVPLGGPAAGVNFQAAAGQDQSYTFTVSGPYAK